MPILRFTIASSGEIIGTRVWGAADTLGKVLDWVASTNGATLADLTLRCRGQAWTATEHGSHTLEALGLSGNDLNPVLVEVVMPPSRHPGGENSRQVNLHEVTASIIDLFGRGSTATAQRPPPGGLRVESQSPTDATGASGLEQGPEFAVVNENLMHAIEFAPEHFAPVLMLYLKCEINGYPAIAFIDTGAQTSIISKAVAESCGIGHLVDTRRAFTGVAVGVGEQKIIGRLHMVPLKVDTLFLPFSFSVLESTPFDVLIGLDQLRRHQMVVNLKSGCLEVDSAHVSFLSEWELKEAKAEVADARQRRAEDGAPAAKKADETPEAPLPSPVFVSEVTPHQHTPSPQVEPMGTEKEARIAALIAFTGIEDAAQAKELLETTNWDLDAASALYFDD